MQIAKLQNLILTNNVMELWKMLESGELNVDSVVNNRGDTMLHFACQSEKTEIIDLLLEYGVRTNIGNSSGVTSLFFVTDLNVIQRLINGGANVSQRDNKGNIPLHLMVIRESLKLVDIHLKNGAHPLTFNLFDETPILFACKLQSSRIIRHLIRYAGQMSLIYPNKDGKTGLHIASDHASLSVIKYLLMQTADINVNEQDLSLKTALHYAVVSGNKIICKILLEHGARMDIMDKYNWKPIHYALHLKEYTIIELFLIEYGDTLDYDHRQVRTFIDEINTSCCTDNHVKLIAFHLFVDNHVNINRIITTISNAECRMYLQELQSMECQMMVANSNTVITFPNIFKKSAKALSTAYRNFNIRQWILNKLTNCKSQTANNVSTTYKQYFMGRWQLGLRTLLYSLFNCDHVQNTVFAIFQRSILENILDYLSDSEVIYFYKAF